MTERAAVANVEVGEHERPRYVRIWAVLVVLLVISVVGPMFEMPAVTAVTAFGVAIVKAYLVVVYFMHLTIEPKYVGYLLAAMVAFVLLFYAGIAPDVQRHEGEQWVNVAAQREVERALAAAGGTTVGSEDVTVAFDATREFETTCGVCHGTEGAGDGPAAASLDPRPANFTDPAFWASRDRARIRHVISAGAAAVGGSPIMPSFGSRYDDTELDALVDHVLELAPEGAIALEEDRGTGDVTDEVGVSPSEPDEVDLPPNESDADEADSTDTPESP